MPSIEQLLANNRAWRDQTERDRPGFFQSLSNQQEPRFLWIGCADSRVPANQIIGLEPGQVFVHRNVANLVVHSDGLGHTSAAAFEFTLAGPKDDGEAPKIAVATVSGIPVPPDETVLVRPGIEFGVLVFDPAGLAADSPKLSIELDKSERNDAGTQATGRFTPAGDFSIEAKDTFGHARRVSYRIVVLPESIALLDAAGKPIAGATRSSWSLPQCAGSNSPFIGRSAATAMPLMTSSQPVPARKPATTRNTCTAMRAWWCNKSMTKGVRGRATSDNGP